LKSCAKVAFACKLLILLFKSIGQQKGKGEHSKSKGFSEVLKNIYLEENAPALE